MNSYELSRNWFDYTFENTEKVKPTHTALYFFIIEQCNRMGWKENFSLPTDMTMEALGIKNWRTYSKTLNDLIDFGFIKLIEKSKNQWTANVIAIVKNTKAHAEALTVARTKAMQNHVQKQSSSTNSSIVISTNSSIGSSIAVIYKHINNKLLKPQTTNLINHKPKVFFDFIENNLDLIFKEKNNENLKKENSEKKSEVEIYPTGDDFWDLYDKKIGNQTKIKQKFYALPLQTRLEIYEKHLPEYVKSTPNKKFRVNPQRYLEEEYWKNEIINYEQSESNTKTTGASSDFRRKTAERLGIVQP